MRFRKKPVVIEARRLTHDNAQELASWCGGAIVTLDNAVGITVPTLIGIATVGSGDWIIKGVRGEFYPCAPDVFEATYEPAE